MIASMLQDLESHLRTYPVYDKGKIEPIAAPPAITCLFYPSHPPFRPNSGWIQPQPSRLGFAYPLFAALGYGPLLNSLSRRMEDDFMLFAIRYDDAAVLAKKAAAGNNSDLKKIWLAKVEETCKFAKVLMSSENVAALKTELLGQVSFFKNHSQQSPKTHLSYQDLADLAAHLGQNAISEHFRRLARD